RETWVRSSVLELLSKLSSPSDVMLKDILLAALQDPQSAVQRAAVRAMETLALAHDLQVRDHLLTALQHSDSRVRTRATPALSIAVEDKRVTSALLRVQSEDEQADTRQMATRVLATIKQPEEEVLAGMLLSLEDNDTGVRKEAAAAL